MYVAYIFFHVSYLFQLKFVNNNEIFISLYPAKDLSTVNKLLFQCVNTMKFLFAQEKYYVPKNILNSSFLSVWRKFD